MFIPVLYISTLIHLFSVNYMAEDPHNQRFFSYLSLFTFFMLVLVSGANFFVLFVGQISRPKQTNFTTICWDVKINTSRKLIKKYLFTL